MNSPMTSNKQELLKLMLAKKGIRLDKKASVRPRGSVDKIPLSYAQERLWFIDQLQPDNTGYNVPGTWRMLGSMRVGVLERVVNEITRRHEVLRTTFAATTEGTVQVIHPH